MSDRTMSDGDFLTTKTKQWNDLQPSNPPKWTTQGDCFHRKFEEGEGAVPLERLSDLADNVQKMRCTETGEVVAVKKLDTFGDEKLKTRIYDEVKVLRSLNHYHCIRVLGCYTEGDWSGIVTQPVAHCDLMRYLSHKKSSRVQEVEEICGPRAAFLPKLMGCLAYTLHYIHKDPTVRHRDIKPENILLEGKRVLYADFGLSKEYAQAQTGTSGPSLKTLMYTSPERESNMHRNRTDDIFSLACVFAEIFTVYKGRTVDEFRDYRIKADPKGVDGYFHRTVSAVIDWLEGLANERCDVQIVRLLRNMFDKPDRRPSAVHVWKFLTACTAGNGTTFFCGPCCMPQVYDDPSFTASPVIDPSQTQYASALTTTNPVGVSTDKYFKQHYRPDEQLDIRWVRNLRHWDRSILDVVQDGKRPSLLARKRLQSSENTDVDASLYARNEVEILRAVGHRHIVQLYGTYRQGSVCTLLYEPAANSDLRSYLELIELKYQRSGIQSNGQDFNFLTCSFGCLSNALAHLHKRGYDHNDIRPENILVHDMGQSRRIYLSKFSFGLKSEAGAIPSRTYWRFLDLTGKLLLGWKPQNGTVPKSKNENILTGQYRAPGLKPTSVGQPPADVFALGCVFLEMLTVLSGRKIRRFEQFRADQEGDTAYCNTLPKVLEWLSQLDMREVHDIIKCMIDKDAERRPTALEVSQSLGECRNRNGLRFAGDCAAS